MALVAVPACSSSGAHTYCGHSGGGLEVAAPEYVGWPVDAAAVKAASEGLRFRIVAIDGTCPTITADLNHNRISAAVEQGIVVAAWRF